MGITQTGVKTIAKVSILDCPYSVSKQFDYLVPEALVREVREGMFVIVPFGASNKRMLGLVHGVGASDTVYRTKPILETVTSMQRLTDEQLRLCEFVAERCFCTIGTALKAVVPSSVIPNAELKFVVANDNVQELEKLNDKALTVFSYIRNESLKGASITESKLEAEFGDEASAVSRFLIKSGFLDVTEITDAPTGDKFEKVLSLSDEVDPTDLPKMTPKQQMLAEYLAEYGELTQNDVTSRLPITESVIRSAVKNGFVVCEKRPVMRNPFEKLYDEVCERRDVELSETQRSALDKLVGLYDSHEAKAALLFGVTGSGKTMVMKKLIDRVTADGKKVIMLLPEIALTPQAVGIFIAYYGKRVAVFHSGLSIGQRHDAWKAAQRGDVDLIIGTRSAVFTPVKDLGLIIIDEEQESTYKSDISPKYHARDVARFRCGYNGAMLLLASATPSIESYYKAEKGDYTLVKLTERYGKAVLPDTMIADMRYNAEGEGSGSFSKQLLSEIKARMERGEKSVLFINRRGYHVFMSCRECGQTVMCPNCSVSLTLHRKKLKNGSTSQFLMCHYCGYTTSPPKVCPSCGKEALRYFGLGTQKIEDEIASALPEAVTVRMDADSTVARMSHKKIIDKFSEDGTDILVGTQMVTKGHDFKDVTLVGILSADMSLHSDDFRANERTFSLITQCAGRAGRSGKKGLAVIQTYTPKHPVIVKAAAQDYESFYKDEIAIRREMVFPPFCDFAVMTLHSINEHDLAVAAGLLRTMLDEAKRGAYRDVAMIAFGPFESGIYKLNNSFRMKLVIKCKNNKRTREMLSDVLKNFSAKAPKSVSAGIDMDPSNV